MKAHTRPLSHLSAGAVLGQLFSGRKCSWRLLPAAGPLRQGVELPSWPVFLRPECGVGDGGNWALGPLLEPRGRRSSEVLQCVVQGAVSRTTVCFVQLLTTAVRKRREKRWSGQPSQASPPVHEQAGNALSSSGTAGLTAPKGS